MTYQEKLETPEWRALRSRIFEERNHTCEDCGEERPAPSLNLHHKYYEFGREVHEYPDDCFKVLCIECHKHTTEAIKSLRFTVGEFTGDQIVAFTNALQLAIIDSRNPTQVLNWMLYSLSHPGFFKR